MKATFVSGRLHRKNGMCGSGMGSVLMNDGGAGSGSSYMSVSDYEKTTGNNIKGQGLGGGLGGKLERLLVKPSEPKGKKKRNIHF